jgi:Cyclic nucleotide-binding domain
MSGPSTFAQSTPGRSRTACSRTNRRSGTPIATASSTHPNSRRFKGPTPPSQTRISDILTRTRTAKSRARAGDLGDALYIVAHGNVEILASGLRPAEGSGGSGEAITQLGARHAFGEMALLSGGPRTATIRAVEDTELMNIGKDDFDHWRVGSALALVAHVMIPSPSKKVARSWRCRPSPAFCLRFIWLWPSRSFEAAAC